MAAAPAPRLALWLALSGLVPYLIVAAWLPFADRLLGDDLIVALIKYAAVVLGFLGGVRWGAELARAPDAPNLKRLMFGGLITVPAWIALLMTDQPLWSIGILVLLGFAQLNWDLASARVGLLPGWTYRMRIALTLIATACMGVAALSAVRLIGPR